LRKIHLAHFMKQWVAKDYTPKKEHLMVAIFGGI